MSGECIQCGHGLSQYNPGTLCFSCQEKKRNKLVEDIGEGPNYTVYDMSNLLGLSSEQVRRLSRKGELPGRIRGIRRHLFQRATVDAWIRSSGEFPDLKETKHNSELAFTTLKLVKILEYYYEAGRSEIVPTVSMDFPYTTHQPGSPILKNQEFSDLMAHLQKDIPEIASIAEYPSECKKYFASNYKSKDEVPTADITGALIMKLKLFASQGKFPGKCPRCPR